METNIPIHAPLYPSNLEYYGKDVDSIVSICEASEEGIKEHLKDTPFNYYTNKVIVEGNHMKECSIGDFIGTGVIIPVEYQGEYGGYYAYCYVDTDNGVALGREPYGYPKKQAEFIFNNDGNNIRSLTTRHDKNIIDIKGEITEAELEEPMVKGLPHFMVQAFPDVDGKSLLVHRIIKRDTSQPPSETYVKKMVNATVSIEASSEDPIHTLGIGKVHQTFYSNGYFHWAPGYVMKDFNQK